MAATAIERRVRIAQHLRIFVQAMRREAADIGALPAADRNGIAQFVAAAREIISRVDPQNGSPD